MRLQVCGGPVIEKRDRWLRCRHRDHRRYGRLVRSPRTIGRRSGGLRDRIAHDMDDGFVRPPARPLQPADMRCPRPVEQPSIATDGGPAGTVRFPQIVDAGPQEHAGISRIVAHRQPVHAIMPVLRTNNAATRVLTMRCHQLAFAIVLADHVQHVGKAVGIVAGHVRPEQPHRDRAGRIISMGDVEQ